MEFNIKGKGTLPMLVFRKCIEISVSVFLSSLTCQIELFSNKSEK